MTDEPLARLEPFIHGDGTPRDKLTRKQALALHNELMLRLPYITASLRDVVTRDGVILGKGPREDSLSVGEWLVDRSRLVPAAKPASPDPFWTGEPVLSVPTMSACCRVGCFFGDCINQTASAAEWKLDTSNKRHVFYHQTVLMVPGSKEMLEPFRITMNYVRQRLLDNRPETLGEVFDIWVEILSQS